MTAIERICEAAEKEVGYLEKSRSAYMNNPAVVYEKTAGAGYDNYTKYARDIDAIDWYNGVKNGYAWCSVFVDWLFIQTFGFVDAIRIKNHGIYDAVVDYAIDQYRAVGRYFREPMVGDQIFFCDADGDPSHTGLVVGVGNGFITTVEGNTSDSDGVVANGGCVAKKRYSINYSRILGYGRPFYELAEEEDEEIKEDDAIMYNAIDHLPDWGVEAITALVDAGFLKGGGGAFDKEGRPADLNLSFDLLRTLVIVHRILKRANLI